MNIVIVGGGKRVEFLVDSLREQHHEITIISDDQDECRRFAHEHDVQVVYGDGSKRFVLEDAGTDEADLVIALTRSDADNLVICQYAKRYFNVRRAFATVRNPKNVDVFQKLGVSTAISATFVLASVIEQMLTARDIVSYMPAGDGSIQFVEVLVEEGSAVCGKSIENLRLPTDSLIGCVVRDGEFVAPADAGRIRAGDKLAVLADPSVQRKVLRALRRR